MYVSSRSLLLWLALGHLALPIPYACAPRQIVCDAGAIVRAGHECPSVDPPHDLVAQRMALAREHFAEGVRNLSSTPPDSDAALRAFEAAFVADPALWQALENVGLLRMEQGDYIGAAEGFEQERELMLRGGESDASQARLPESWLNEGVARARAEHFERARACFEMAATYERVRRDALANLASLTFRLRDFDGAKQYVRELLVESRHDPYALSILALVYEDEGEQQMATYVWETGLDTIERRLERCRDEDQYSGLNAEEVAELRDYNRALIARLSSALSAIRNAQGVSAWESGNHDRAEFLFRESIAADSSNYAALANLAAVNLEYARFDLARDYFASVLEFSEENEVALVGLAASIYGNGEIESSWEAYERAFAAFPDNAVVARRLGEIAFRDFGDVESARMWLERSLAIRGMDEETCDESLEACALLRGLRLVEELDAR